MATININIGKDDVLNINVAGTQQAIDGKEVIDALYEKLYSALGEYNHKRYEEEHSIIIEEMTNDEMKMIYGH